jgi:hypothetical protein
MIRRSVFAGIVLVIAAGIPGVAQRATALPDLHTDDLARGPYARMQMLLERTIFKVDVLTVDVQVGEHTRQRLEQLAGGAAPLESVEDQIVAAVLDVDQVLVTLIFRRSVGFDRWLGEVRASLQKARDAGLITEQALRDVGVGLPQWFQPMVARGWSTGDRVIYRGYPDRMRTLVVLASGEVVVDQTDGGAAPRRTMLAGYFAPGTDIRGPLIASLRAR